MQMDKKIEKCNSVAVCHDTIYYFIDQFFTQA
jgi:hypothetical protein